ncbi:ABC transporter transmembrane domain-containing protein [uncultured Bosea sp.]|uniref:ATP-binding cassette domain-containing protein n=1 Tax=uncultured Bosea sp. TaxID=211457 RepID=UPI0025D800F0|nr:ABC transporter transmembrane domain-containing protein [uncultured Bosea sp.]
MALVVGRLVMGGDPALWSIVALPPLIVAGALAGYAAERCQASAETRVSIGLRALSGERLQALPATLLTSLPAGALTIALHRHPQAVARLVVGHRAAVAMTAGGPLLAAAALASVSWPSALLVLLLTPVMIVFFALVGGAMQARAAEQERSFRQLAGQFADRIRALPTILANDALAIEADKLSGRMNTYAERTMGVLRLAFVNAGLIDFFASLSIAMLAVFLGLGHLGLATLPGFARLELWQSLFILMIAPEFFAPFRRLSEQYHAKAEGLAAAEALDRLLDPVRSPARPVDVIAVDLDLPSRGLVVITGPSGAGKSTLLRRLAGLDGVTDAAEKVDHPTNCVWIAIDCLVVGRSLAEAICADIPPPTSERLCAMAQRLGLLDDGLLPGGLAAPIVPGGANLSGGQRLRIAVARALLSDRTIIADEPTAKLDAVAARTIRLALHEAAAHRLVLVASHDPELIALADRRVHLQGGCDLEGTA